MKTRYNSTFFVILGVALMSQLLLIASGHAGTKDLLHPGPVRPSGLDYSEEPHGYLVVYSATDRYEDGGVPYYPHSSYLIYRADGRLYKTVENHTSYADEVPEVVILPTGSYTIDVRSERDQGNVRVRVLIQTNRRTVLNFDETKTNRQFELARSRQAKRLVD